MAELGFLDERATRIFYLRSELLARADVARERVDARPGQLPGLIDMLKATFFDDGTEVSDNLLFLARCVDPSRQISGKDLDHLMDLVSTFTKKGDFLRAATHISYHLRDGDYGVSADTIRAELRSGKVSAGRSIVHPRQ